ncbi:Gti1/Pac2 family protein [Apiospora arundinis]
MPDRVSGRTRLYSPHHTSTGATLQPVFIGYISSTMDALVLFEACLTGHITHVPRRPHEQERAGLIRSGNVFIYEEHSSGIKRWTDGIPWSPSRIMGNFLMYRELDKPFLPGEKKRPLTKSEKSNGVRKSISTSRANLGGFAARYSDASGIMKDVERALVGSLVDSYQFKPDGLVKKTISVQYMGARHCLVSYYNIEDVINQKLRTPLESPYLQHIKSRAALISAGDFRAPIDDHELIMNDRMRLFTAQSHILADLDPSRRATGDPTQSNSYTAASLNLPPPPVFMPHTHLGAMDC